MKKFWEVTFKKGNYLEKKKINKTDGVRERTKKRALNVLSGAVEVVAIPLKTIGRLMRNTFKQVTDVIAEPFERGDNNPG